jgi:uncharacterized protein YjbI with pentapeptide repeats
MRTITFPEATSKAAALAALLLGGGLALAPEARAGVTLNGVVLNGSNLNGSNLNGVVLNGVVLNGQHTQGRPAGGEVAGTADLAALQVRAVRLPDGRTLLARQR